MATSLFLYNERGSVIYIKVCPECEKERKTVNLRREVTTRTGNKKHYPYLVYPFTSLISSLQSLLLQPDFYVLCEMWRCNQRDHLNLSDIYDGGIWRTRGGGLKIFDDRSTLPTHPVPKLSCIMTTEYVQIPNY